MRIALPIALVLVITSCIGIRQVTCPGGYCAIEWLEIGGVRAGVPRDPAAVEILRAPQAPARDVRRAGLFRVRAGCTDQILGWFRNKAANLGFDGVIVTERGFTVGFCEGAPFLYGT